MNPSLSDAMAQVETARAALQTLRSTHATALAAWNARLAQIPADPVIPPALPLPVAPVDPRPTPDQTTAARTLLANEPARVAVHAQHGRTLDAAEKAQAESKKKHRAAVHRADTLEALVQLVKTIPSVLFGEQIHTLQLPAGLTLEAPLLEHDRIPYLRVTWDGYDWTDDKISDGRRVVGSLLFRAALRRAAATTLGPDYALLPLVVDHVQLYNGGHGPWPQVESPVWWLVTTAEPTLEILPGHAPPREMPEGGLRG